MMCNPGYRGRVRQAPCVVLFSLAAFAVCFVSFTKAATPAGQPRFLVTAGDSERENTPVSVTLEGLQEASLQRRLVEITDEGDIAVASQVEAGNPPRLWWILTGTTPAGKTRVFELREGPAVKAEPVTVQKLAGSIEVACGDRSVLRYNSAHVDAPPEANPLYGRSAFIHPVFTPSGQLVTDNFPPDHYHQNGVFSAFPNTSFEGRKPNFWELARGSGRVRFAGLKSMASGPIFGRFRVVHEHVDLTQQEGKVALVETWDLCTWNIGGPDAGFWVWDLTSTLRCASSSPLLLPKYHYGGTAIRGSRKWYGEDCRFATSNGKTRENGNHDRARWTDIAGRSNGVWSGVTVMTHPENFRFPEPVRIHPTMPYMVYTPVPLGDWTLEPGNDYVRRYRFLVHDGELQTALAERVWQDFAQPPAVTLHNEQRNTLTEHLCRPAAVCPALCPARRRNSAPSALQSSPL